MNSFKLAAFAAAPLLAGCASSTVIPSTDTTFNRATERLERTAVEVDATGAPSRERVLFMQSHS